MDDFIFLEEKFTAEENLLRDSVRKWVDAEVLPIIGQAYEQAELPSHLLKRAADLGLLGMTLPEEYGGSDASAIAYGLACQELERGDSGLRSFVSVQSSLCMYPIFAYGTKAQKQQYLPKMAQADLIGCFGLTEANSGSDPGGMQTKATPVAGGWKLNGSKLWITNAVIADVAIVFAKTPNGVRGFLVDKGTPGFSAQPIKHKLSMRASHTGELIFQDCFIGEEQYLPGTDIGLKAALSCLTKARYGIAWGAMGAAMACFDIALAYAKQRQQFSRPIASFQLLQKSFADMFTEITKAQLLNYRLGELCAQNKLTPVMVSMAKMNSAANALSIARECRNILGANGISLEYHVMRHLQNLETVFTYEGTDNVHHLVIGKHLTGINAFFESNDVRN